MLARVAHSDQLLILPRSPLQPLLRIPHLALRDTPPLSPPLTPLPTRVMTAVTDVRHPEQVVYAIRPMMEAMVGLVVANGVTGAQLVVDLKLKPTHALW